MRKIDEIGGYFGLELPLVGEEYHKDAIHLNSGRSALQYNIKAKKYRKIYLPTYICNSVLTPIQAENIEYEYYNINARFFPIFDKEIGVDDAFLYVNYFGINDKNVEKVVAQYRNVIIDNTQAFYSIPISGIDTFYSVRKFFGVADGAYLYSDTQLDMPLEVDVSYERMGHLLIRHDLSVNAGYALFRENDEKLDKIGLKVMSRLTQAILTSIDYEKCRQIRRENYEFLHGHLGEMNLLELPELGNQTPMVYPFLTIDGRSLKEELIKEQIYVATYWPEMKTRNGIPPLESSLVDGLVPLPIDQRYSSSEMQRILEVIDNFYTK